ISLHMHVYHIIELIHLSTIINLYCIVVKSLSYYCHLHSFPTRRSSDLAQQRFCQANDIEDRRAFHWEAFIRKRHPNSTGNGHSQDRKSTRLNSSHEWISYAVFCLNKKVVIVSIMYNVH